MKPRIFKDRDTQAKFDRDGYVVIDFISKAEAKTIAEKFYELHTDLPSGFYSAAFNPDEGFRENIYSHTNEVFQKVLDEKFQDIKKLGSTFLCKAPGNEGKVAVHQDWTVVDESKYYSATIWVPTIDTTEENGALKVLPGSHLFFNTYRSPNIEFPFIGQEELIWENMITVPVKAGQAFVLNHAVLHGSSLNKTDTERLVVAYGIAPANAPLIFYHKEKATETKKVEKFEMPDDFFQQYYNCGDRPLFGKVIEELDYSVGIVSTEKLEQLIADEKEKRGEQMKLAPQFQPSISKKTTVKSLTISIPAYNDGQSLVKLVEEVHSVCKQLDLTFEILIINDGSSDDTLKVSNDLGKKYGNITIINHHRNLGFGETLKKVFMLPKTEWVLFLPGDNQFPASNLLRFLEMGDTYDYILGYRNDRKDTANRKLYSFFYNWLVSVLSGYKVKDVNSIVFYRSSIFNKIQLKGKSAFVHAEFFIRTSKAGFNVTEIKVLHQEREFGFGSGGNLRVAANAFKELFLYIAGKI